jgi:hypothetical protein
VTTEHTIEQAVRRSHCAHADREDSHHQCIGTCHITPQGLTLDCKACGKDERSIAPADLLPETKLVRIVLDALGISYDALTPEYKARAANAARSWMDRRHG